MSKVAEYLEWSEIRSDIGRTDLLEIIDMAWEVGLDQAVEDYIKENYEPVMVIDVDRAYDEMRDDKFTEEP